ncbi:MAG: bifunctional aldolase/short-chain dehydrogenase [Rhodospirillaceae bacterium]|nr:bifunctional aldolase/short-chain dehydrogenase [Rhodospirillaceae bacterium]
MQNKWSDAEASEYVSRYASQGVNEDLALRVYTSRLLGREPDLVLHGGGNTSVKTEAPDIMGEPTQVLCVKGSGWDMGDIEPAGLPAVRLEPLRKLIALDALSDEDMVNAQRTNLLDAAAPNPSVETLLHAFLPHKFVDHTHSNAMLALSDQPNGDEICRELFGDRVAYVPYKMPGFALAKSGRECFDAAIAGGQNEVEGMVLLKHGLFSFGSTAKEAYDRMIDLVTLAEERIESLRTKTITQVIKPPAMASVADVAPILRGLVAEPVSAENGVFKRMVLEFRADERILTYVNGSEVNRYSQQGTATPDHVIRIKQKPLILTAPEAGKLDVWRSETEKRLADYISEYEAYFARNNPLFDNSKKQLDPYPRIVLVPGLGLFGVAASAKDARVTTDLGEVNVMVISEAEETGAFEGIEERDVFEIEHWSLEQAKLGKAAEKPMQRHVVAVTGGGSGIGAATARAFAAEGAEVAVLDRDLEAAKKVAGEIKGLAVACDVTEDASVAAAFTQVCERYGGVDVVVSNAGAAWQGKIGEVDAATLRDSFELNFWGHQRVAQAAVKVMRTQGTGGCLLFNTSKQAINPGKDFGPYGLPKAATLFLMKQYALDHAADGIRANAVNADRIRSGLVTDEMIAARSKARGVSEQAYMSGNLLGREVVADDVASAFVHLAKAPKTTAAVLTVDGGNIEASLR